MNNQTEKKPNKVLNVLFSVWVTASVLLIQVGVGLGFRAFKTIQFVKEAGGDILKGTQNYEVWFSLYSKASPILTYLQLAAEIVCIIVFFLWYFFGYVKKDKKNGTYKRLGLKFNKTRYIFFVFFGCISIGALAVTLNRIATALMPKAAKQVQSGLQSTLSGSLIIGLVIAVILAPIAEELAMRGIILQHSKKAFGLVGCMIISGVMFGLMHANPIQGIYVLPMGLFWGFLAYRFDSVIPCIVCHMFNNLTTGVIDQLSYGHPEIVFIVFGVLAAFLGVRTGVFNFNEKEKENEDGEELSEDR